MSNIRKKYTSQEKVKIALEALKGELTINQITSKYGVHATQVSNWKKKLKESLSSIFSDKRSKEQKEQTELIDELYKQIGQLSVELEWLKKKCEQFN